MVGFGLNTGRTADAVGQVLEDRELGVLAAISVSSIGGLVGADMVANRVLPILNLSPTPTSVTDTLASAGLKGLMALGLGVAAADMTGIAQLALVFGAVGVSGSAVLDILTSFFDVPQLVQVQRQVGSRSSRRPRRRAGSSTSQPQSSGGSASVSVSNGGGKAAKTAF